MAGCRAEGTILVRADLMVVLMTVEWVYYVVGLMTVNWIHWMVG